LPKAWEIISSVLQAAALVEIETDGVLRDRPPDFRPPRAIVNPESFRRRPSFEETIIEDRVVDMFVDKKTGALFADQSKQRPGSVVRQFREVTYLPMELGNAVLPFYRDLKFPRLDDSGGPLFDGSKINSPRDVLLTLSSPRPERHQRQRQVRIEPLVPIATPSLDGGPTVVT
jgi:hypothetical protein